VLFAIIDFFLYPINQLLRVFFKGLPDAIAAHQYKLIILASVKYFDLWLASDWLLVVWQVFIQSLVENYRLLLIFYALIL